MVRVSEADESFIRPDPEASSEEFMNPMICTDWGNYICMQGSDGGNAVCMIVFDCHVW